MIDNYFRRPILWDIILSGLYTGVIFFCLKKHFIHIPGKELVSSTASDISTVALTCAGFILTLVTLLISFKSTIVTETNRPQEDRRTFDLFFESPFYTRTIEILNNSIKVLAIVALLGYSLKILMSDNYLQYLLFYCVFAVGIIFLTIWRCVMILSKIVKIQVS